MVNVQLRGYTYLFLKEKSKSLGRSMSQIIEEALVLYFKTDTTSVKAQEDRIIEALLSQLPSTADDSIDRILKKRRDERAKYKPIYYDGGKL